MKFLTFIAIIVVIWLVGLFAFADRVRGYTPAEEPARADAIVALTGPSAERVNAAIRLLEQDKGARVLISAHGNSLRALVKHLSGISDAEITGLEIPTGQPIVYELDDGLAARERYYLSER